MSAKCPFCRSEISMIASVCPSCRSNLSDYQRNSSAPPLPPFVRDLVEWGFRTLIFFVPYVLVVSYVSVTYEWAWLEKLGDTALGIGLPFAGLAAYLQMRKWR